jgi:hypothetical protein
MIRLFGAILACLCLLAPSARAFDPMAAMGGSCTTEQLGKLCSNDTPGTPGFSACSKAHMGEALAACQKQTQDAAAAKTHENLSAKSPCMDDAKKFCPGKWPGTPEFSACMKSHSAEVTPACAAWGKKRAGMNPQAKSDACVADAKKLCPALTVMDGSKFTDCMTSHYDGLSPECQAKFKGLNKAKQGSTGDCMAALKTLCPGAVPGSPEMTSCMMTHHADLPPSCHKHGS